MHKRSVFVAGAVLILILAVLLGSIAWLSHVRGRKTGLVFGEKVAVVEVKGVIADAQPTIENLTEFSKDTSVKAVVVRIESPGGGVSPSQELYQEIGRLASDKPVVVSMGSVAASGGYYIAAAAQKIYANPGTITGSIGVIFQFTNLEELFKKIGFRMEIVKSGAYKDVGNPSRPMTAEERAYLQAMIDNVHQQFVRDVAQGRRMPVEKVREVADGRIFTGEQAKELGLVDELGNLKDAIDAAAKMAAIEGEPKVVYPDKEKRSLLDYLVKRAAEGFTRRVGQYMGLLLLCPLPGGAYPS
ncbi:MAG: signal peptide peptidase SppA [Deltaproteobacteria bacterium]|nr:MAG: signal peptide peptidase SppA [Deltaproteobacteria bacterium]